MQTIKTVETASATFNDYLEATSELSKGSEAKTAPATDNGRSQWSIDVDTVEKTAKKMLAKGIAMEMG